MTDKEKAALQLVLALINANKPVPYNLLQQTGIRAKK